MDCDPVTVKVMGKLVSRIGFVTGYNIEVATEFCDIESNVEYLMTNTIKHSYNIFSRYPTNVFLAGYEV